MKKAMVICRAQRALFGNLAEGEEFGSLAYHDKGSSNLRDAAVWVKDAIPALRRLAAECRYVPHEPKLPYHFWRVKHNVSAEVRGNSVIGLHFFMDDFGKKYVVHSMLQNPGNGVCAISFTLKNAKVATEPKFSTVFPRSFTSFEQVMRLVDAAPTLARAFNRKLVCIRHEGIDYYVESLLQERDTIVCSGYPCFEFMHYAKDRDVTIAGKAFKSADLLQMAKTALSAVRPEIVDQDSPLRYLILKDGDVDLVLDLAPQVGLKVLHGIMLSIPASTFKDDDRLAAHIVNIVKHAAKCR